MTLLLARGLLLIAAGLLGAALAVVPSPPGLRFLDLRESSEVRAYFCHVCEVDATQDCTSLVATPCTLLSVCSRCTVASQPAYCVFSFNPFNSCTDLGAVKDCGNEELGQCNMATGVCTFQGVILAPCRKIADCS